MTYQACPNGVMGAGLWVADSQEALARYKPDGGSTWSVILQTDYSNVNHGICVCDNCKRTFQQMFGRDLPKADGFADPAWRDYLEFQERTSGALAEKVRVAAAALIPRRSDHQLRQL